MKLTFSFRNSFLLDNLAGVLIVISIFINMIVAERFYYILGVDYFLVLIILAGAIITEKIYSQLFKRLYLRVGLLLLCGYAYFRYLLYIKLDTPEKLLDFYNDINVKVYYSQPLDFYHIMPQILLILSLATFIWLRMDRLNRGNWMLILQFLFLCNISFFTNDYAFLMAFNVLILIAYTCLNTYKKIKLKAKKQNILLKLDYHKIVIYYAVVITIIFVAAIGVMGITGNKSASELRQIMRNKILKNVMDNSNKLYDLGAMGYGEKFRLGGPLTLQQGIQFRVESDKPYYLKGNIKDNYTGTQWERTTRNFFVSDRPITRLLDKEVQGKLLGVTPSDAFVEPKSMTIYNETVNDSTSLFTPNNTVMVTANKKTIGSSADNIYMLLDKDFGLNFYTTSFYESSTGMDDFNIFHEKRLKFDYNPIEDSAYVDMTYKQVKEIYSNYLQMPESITPRTKELEKQITKEAVIVEDKIYNIMQYLRKNYAYELNVSKLPDDRDFIDYFLFDEKKGYCTYFATAAVMLCRLEGIPARYVEGFSMESTKDSDGLYVVKSSAAHSWCEVLVSAKYDLWARLECTPSMPKPGTDIIQKNNENIRKLMNNKGEKIDIKAFTSSKDMVVSKIKSISASTLKILSYILAVIISVMLLAGFMHLIIRKWKSMKLVRKILNSNKINLLYYHVKKRLLSVGIDNSSSLSEHEYLDNIKDEELKKYIGEIVSIYEQEYYADKAVKIVYDKKNYYKKIEKCIRKKQNIIRYVIDKYELADIAFSRNNNRI